MITKNNNYTLKDFENEKKVIEPFSNAFQFMEKYLPSNTKQIFNIFNLEYKDINDEFDEPNFIDDYKESSWWVLNYNNDTFFIDINEIEGSQISKLNDNMFQNFSKEAENFYYQLKKQLNK